MEEKKSLTLEEQKLASAPILKLLLAYAIPSILSMVVNALYNIVDQIFIGNIIGYLGNGATNIIYPVSISAMSIALLLGSGGGALFSLRLGEQKYDEARSCIGTATTMTLVISLVLTFLAAIFLEPLCRLFGCTDDLLPYALEYGRIILIGCPVVPVIMTLSNFIRSDGSPTIAMLAMLCGAILNIILDPFFMLVFDMGIRGAAWATVISQCFGLLITIPYIWKFKTVKLKARDFLPDWKVFGKTCKLGLSSFISQMAMIFLIGLLNNAYVHYGALSKYGADIPLTTIGICSKLCNIVVAFAMGMNMGSQPIVGYNYGAGNIDRVKKTYKTAVSLTIVLMLIGTFMFELFPAWFINLFGSESELYTEFAVHAIKIFMLPLVLNGVISSITIFFQAIGQPFKSAILSSLREVVLLVPAVLIIPKFLGLDGVIISAPTSDVITFIIAVTLMLVQWKKLGKEKKKI